MPSPVLTLLKEITLSLDKPNDLVFVAAKQYDMLARKVKINLLFNNAPWVVPSGLNAVIRYIKPDRTMGMYDTDDDGNPAIVITAGTNSANPGYVTITLARQVLTAKGTVKVEVSLYSSAAEKLTTFAFPLVVEEAALSDIPFYESENYFSFTQDMATIAQLNAAFITATQAAVSGTLTIDNTLSIAGAIADAKAAGDMIMVSETQPSPTSNILWIQDPEEEVLIPTMEDIENIVAGEYDSTKTYSVGDYCIHNGYLCKCIYSIDSAESWNLDHWAQVLLAEELSKANNLFNIFSDQIADDTQTEQGTQISGVIKHDGYVWASVSPGVYTAQLVAQNNRTAVEFEAKPNTEYVIHGNNAGTTINYPIAFYPKKISNSTASLTNATQITWNGKNRCTRFRTPGDCHYIRYVSYQDANYYGQYIIEEVHTYSVKDSAISDNIQRSTDYDLQTISKNIVGAINELYGGGGGGGSYAPWIVPPSGEDDTNAIESALSTYGYCKLLQGNYHVSTSGINMPVNSTLKGSGFGTKIYLAGDGDYSPGNCVVLNTGCIVEDIAFYGWTSDITLDSTLQNRNGLLWSQVNGSSPYRCIIKNCFFIYFKGSGIKLDGTGADLSNSMDCSACWFYMCRAGVNIVDNSEFHRFTDIHITACYYAVINNGGNNMFANCILSKNRIGFLLDNTGNTKTNPAHGSVVGCIFNHMGNAGPSTPIPSNAYGIRIINSSNGMVFTGCQFFYSKISVEDAGGIVLDHCNFGSSEPVYISGGGTILFDGCMFGSQPVISKTNNDYTHFQNCYVRSTGAAVDGT